MQGWTPFDEEPGLLADSWAPELHSHGVPLARFQHDQGVPHRMETDDEDGSPFRGDDSVMLPALPAHEPSAADPAAFAQGFKGLHAIPGNPVLSPPQAYLQAQAELSAGAFFTTAGPADELHHRHHHHHHHHESGGSSSAEVVFPPQQGMQLHAAGGFLSHDPSASQHQRAHGLGSPGASPELHEHHPNSISNNSNSSSSASEYNALQPHMQQPPSHAHGQQNFRYQFSLALPPHAGARVSSSSGDESSGSESSSPMNSSSGGSSSSSARMVLLPPKLEQSPALQPAQAPQSVQETSVAAGRKRRAASLGVNSAVASVAAPVKLEDSERSSGSGSGSDSSEESRAAERRRRNNQAASRYRRRRKEQQQGIEERLAALAETVERQGRELELARQEKLARDQELQALRAVVARAGLLPQQHAQESASAELVCGNQNSSVVEGRAAKRARWADGAGATLLFAVVTLLLVNPLSMLEGQGFLSSLGLTSSTASASSSNKVVSPASAASAAVGNGYGAMSFLEREGFRRGRALLAFGEDFSEEEVVFAEHFPSPVVNMDDQEDDATGAADDQEDVVITKKQAARLVDGLVRDFYRSKARALRSLFGEQLAATSGRAHRLFGIGSSSSASSEASEYGASSDAAGSATSSGASSEEKKASSTASS